MQKLSALEHTHRKNTAEGGPYVFSYKTDMNNIYMLSPRQFLRTYLLYEALQEKEFIASIGKIVEEDLNDPHSEHGGLIFFDDKLKLRPIPSSLEKRSENNGKYRLPDTYQDTIRFAEFHLHATEEDRVDFAGPSQGSLFSTPERDGDLAAAVARVLKHGESHDVLITSLAKRNFNIDYYCSELMWTPRFLYVDLGNYSYA